MKPFIMVSTRPEHQTAEQEYESFLRQSGLEREQLHHVPLEEVDFLGSFQAGDISGVYVSGSPYDTATAQTSKTRSQECVEEQVREILAVTLKEGIPVLATGCGMDILATYLGTPCSGDYAEELGATDIFLTAAGREDPLLAGMSQTFTAFVGHHEGAVTVPEQATLLASSADCPVHMIRVGDKAYATQFNPELDVERFLQRVSIYADAGYGDPGHIDDILSEARTSPEQHTAGTIIRRFVEHFARD